MPEVILCPHCGTESVTEEYFGEYQIGCPHCGANGPYEDSIDAAIATWSSLPRALTWTNEPPKVAGWYWRKETAADRAHVFHFTGNWEDYGEHWESDRVCQLPLNLNGNLWAGPISPPID